ncbi:hypothetical protein STVIR_6616 [Streptomyces viridochromogenes Tue57]|uniref:Uncharacterized protein n=1 Tax=Streptomyces viridochromogenes Tue57 TaxID=1160705 RepID=L8P8H9_STRVR|nr:hypothetical protein STVIR_6616 [Streptomyces viridochromogenes Tue57]
MLIPPHVVPQRPPEQQPLRIRHLGPTGTALLPHRPPPPTDPRDGGPLWRGGGRSGEGARGDGRHTRAYAAGRAGGVVRGRLERPGRSFLGSVRMFSAPVWAFRPVRRGRRGSSPRRMGSGWEG